MGLASINTTRFNMHIKISFIQWVLFFVSFCFGNTSLALENITLQLKWTHAFQFAGYYAAKEKGYYSDASFDVDIIEASPDTDPVRNVLDGKAQFGVGTSSLLLERAAGKPVVALAVIFQQSPYEIYAAPQIHELRDLIGKRIMLEPQSVELLAFLKKKGIPLDDIQQIPHSFDAAGLMSGRTEAIAGYISNQPFYFKQAHYPYQVFSPRSVGIDFYGDNLFTSERELQLHPERVKAFRAASLKGWQYAKEHRDEVINLILTKYSSKHTKQYTREYLSYESDQMIPLLQPNLIEIGYMNPNRWHDIAKTYTDIGLLQHDVDLKKFLYDATEPDLTKFYRLLIAALCLLLIVVLIALHIHRINLKLLISERHSRLVQESLVLSNAKIERAMYEQGLFMDMLAHEMKTPISVVRMALGNMQVEGPSKRYADRALEDMSAVVDRCRQLGQIEQHKLQPHVQACNINQIIYDLRLSSSIPERIVLQGEFLSDINTDPQLLRIILSNLVSNAVKYSQPGSVIDVHIASAQSDAKDGVAVLIENLPGFAGVPDAEQVFNKFYRSAGAHSQTGSGLGLYLVRRIAELLGGQVLFNEVQGKVRFSLWIPR